ncbi:hypothetical protein [Bacillus sp. AFS001701]|nr:hypothetical protein [Bacillus sp. AFS001701]
MNDHEKLTALINYLSVLCEVSRSSEIKVFAEMQRTISKIEKLINE